MRHVKIFDTTGDGASEIEDAMNKWFRENPDITIESIIFSARSPGDVSKNNRCFVLLVYTTSV